MAPLQDVRILMSSFENTTKSLTIKYGFLNTLLGRILIGVTQLKYQKYAICILYFVVKSDNETFDEARQRWPAVNMVHDDLLVENITSKIFDGTPDPQVKDIDIVVRGTTFEQEVWNALINIDFGITATYSQIAEKIGRPNSVRATARAIAKNEISLLIPCHRVLSKNGAIKYHWGAQLKNLLLQYEARVLKYNDLLMLSD